MGGSRERVDFVVLAHFSHYVCAWDCARTPAKKFLKRCLGSFSLSKGKKCLVGEKRLTKEKRNLHFRSVPDEGCTLSFHSVLPRQDRFRHKCIAIHESPELWKKMPSNLFLHRTILVVCEKKNDLGPRSSVHFEVFFEDHFYFGPSKGTGNSHWKGKFSRSGPKEAWKQFPFKGGFFGSREIFHRSGELPRDQVLSAGKMMELFEKWLPKDVIGFFFFFFYFC